MGEKTSDPPDIGAGREFADMANFRVETDVGALPARPKLHMTGRGLSPAEYRAQHGAHPHQADFSRGSGRSRKGDDVDRREE